MVEWLLGLAVLLLMAALGLQWDWSRLSGWRGNAQWLRQHPREAVPAGPALNGSDPAPVEPRTAIEGRRPGHLRVLGAAELLQVTGASQLLEHLYRHAKLDRKTFERDLLPAVHRFAEFVQLLPGSESHHHANVGGLLAHALETTYHALVLRGGHLLAHASGAEAIDAQRDHWTYAIFLGALMHDVGKPLADMRVDMVGTRSEEPVRWMPMAGSLRECQAHEYHVAFTPKAERDYAAHSRMSLVLMQRLVPASALAFLGRCPEVLEELTQYLGGDARGGTIAKIVSEADQRSTAANLATGSRARFTTARSVPLVEQLMSAMQEMLEQGGQLPLNRDGAAGWVYDGSVWFVAKRLADSVREFVRSRAGEDAGIPGEHKNDRLFDTWMEYGQLVLNPVTKKAIWHVRIHGEDGDGYSHELTMLRFPLDKLWSNPSAYPQVMAGRIEVLEGRKKAATADPQASETPPIAATEVPAQAPVAAAKPHEKKPVAASQAIPAPQMTDTKGRRSKKRPLVDDNAEQQVEVADYLPQEDTARASHRALKAAQAPVATSEVKARAAVAFDTPLVLAGPDVDLGADASPEVLSAPTSLDRVLLPDAKTVPLQTGAKEPSEAAMMFMRWVQTGLADASLKYNEAGAPVHFVEAGIALVSPALFREYALIHGEPEVQNPTKTGPEQVGLRIQREVIRAGWHLPNPVNGSNIWTFQVSRRGGTKVGKLSAIVLADARRWVVEPPPPNIALQPPQAVAEQGQAA